jgi:hypothetical protein
MDYSASKVTRAGLMSHCPWSPVVSWEAGSCPGRVLLHGEAGSGMHSIEGSWLHSAVVDPRNDLCYLNCVGVEKTTKESLQPGFSSWTFYLYPNSIAWFIRVCGSCQANGEFPSYPVIDFWEGQQRTCICCLRVRSPVFLRSPHKPLTKGGGCPKIILNRERHIHLVWWG